MFKAIRNYLIYRRFINVNRDELSNEFNMKIDRLYRMGTRISIPENRIEVLRNYRNSELDVYKNLDEETRKYIGRIDRYFMQKNMSEYVGIYSAERTDYNEVTLIISYKLFNVVKLANVGRVFIGLSIISLFAGFFNLLYMVPGAFIFMLFIFMNTILFKKLFV